MSTDGKRDDPTRFSGSRTPGRPTTSTQECPSGDVGINGREDSRTVLYGQEGLLKTAELVTAIHGRDFEAPGVGTTRVSRVPFEKRIGPSKGKREKKRVRSVEEGRRGEVKERGEFGQSEKTLTSEKSSLIKRPRLVYRWRGLCHFES